MFYIAREEKFRNKMLRIGDTLLQLSTANDWKRTK